MKGGDRIDILHKDKMPDGTIIQIENWNNVYDFFEYGSKIGAYPQSKANGEGEFSPKINRTFRLSITLESYDSAFKCFNDLKEGKLDLNDLVNNFDNRKDANFI